MAETTTRWTIWASLAVAACGDSGNAATGSDPSTTDESGTDEGADVGETDVDPCLNPGVEACPCIDGECVGDLICLSNVCVMPPTPPPTSDDGDTGETGGTGTDGPASCSESIECSATAVCFEEVCRPVYDCVYDVVVFEFVPYAGCSEGGVGGNYDLYYSLTASNQQLHESNWYQGGCPGDWSDETAKGLGANGFDRFYLRFYDEETPGPPFQVDALCFDDGSGMCGGPLPGSHLHAGIFDGVTGEGSAVVVSFTPTACG